MKTAEQGWVVLNSDGDIIYSFTFSRTRNASTKKYTRLWGNQYWKYHYRHGIRCVKAILILKTNQSKPLPSDEVVEKQLPINEYCQWLEDLTTR